MLYDSERLWVTRAACRGHPSETFFTDGPSGPLARIPRRSTQEKWDAAKEICAGCPVLHQCRRATLGEEYGVWGGLDQRQRYLVREALKDVARNWPRGRRLRWGRELSVLRGDEREGGLLTWLSIQQQTGIPRQLAEELIGEWKAHAKTLRKARPATVVPLPGKRVLDFPDGPGRLDLWVRHNRGVSDGHYRGETADGAWVFVQVHSGRGHVQKWVRRADVRFHHRQPAMVRHYEGRPDVPEGDSARSDGDGDAEAFDHASQLLDAG